MVRQLASKAQPSVRSSLGLKPSPLRIDKGRRRPLRRRFGRITVETERLAQEGRRALRELALLGMGDAEAPLGGKPFQLQVKDVYVVDAGAKARQQRLSIGDVQARLDA